jgi:hypothetical protein
MSWLFWIAVGVGMTSGFSLYAYDWGCRRVTLADVLDLVFASALTTVWAAVLLFLFVDEILLWGV